MQPSPFAALDSSASVHLAAFDSLRRQTIWAYDAFYNAIVDVSRRPRLEAKR